MILGRPGGDETVVGERGQGLSGGQRARVASTRTLVRRPRVLVLNEATAALNNESEVAVAAAISFCGRVRNLTVLLIAHRVSSLRRAPRVADVRPLFGL
jgi:ABC-type multidrug transport system fused ATPase/permease subunit